MTGLEAINTERSRQLALGRDAEYDAENNGSLQLIQAASILSSPNPTHTPELETPCPEGWDEGIWEKMLNKPHLERLAIAGALLAAEYDRVKLEDGE